MKNRIGIVGGGQLGRMIGFAAKKMGFYVSVIDPTPKSPAGQVVDHEITADYNDENAIRELAKISDYLTFEIELANAKILDELAERGLQINPSAKTLTIIKDKLKQKKFLKKSKIPIADFIRAANKKDILNAAKKFSYPILLKARFDAYDGRGNALIKRKSDIDSALTKLKDKKLYVEKFVPFTKELAVIIARDTQGNIRSYPVVETIHKNNICHTVFAPALVNKKIQQSAQELAIKVMQQLNGSGVFGIEMFLTKNNNILVNEIAPRVHNSGHYTIEACHTSQFDQHIRAITGMPLGQTDLIYPTAVMVNILGNRNGKAKPAGLHKAHSLPQTYVHIYGKHETRTERKMGHVTAVGGDINAVLENAKRARKYVKI